MVAVGMGTCALVLPRLLPDLSPPLGPGIKSGFPLLLEAESEAESRIIKYLAGTALKQDLSSPSITADPASSSAPSAALNGRQFPSGSSGSP
jgi:hypothetical protein